MVRMIQFFLCAVLSAAMASPGIPCLAAPSVASAQRAKSKKNVGEDKAYRSAVFRVSAGESIGSGFAIGPRLAVTCQHVMEQENGMTVRRAMLISGTGRKIGATLISYDKRSDVALLALDEPVIVWFTIAAEEATIGDRVGMMLSRPEYVAKFSRAEALDLWIDSPCYAGVLTKPLEPGNSGSPIFNARYELVGVVSAILPEKKNLGVFSGLAGLRRLVALNEAVTNRQALPR